MGADVVPEDDELVALEFDDDDCFGISESRFYALNAEVVISELTAKRKRSIIYV